VTVGPEPSPTGTRAALWKYNVRAVRDYHERLALRLRKQILWESETATDAEVRAMEAKLIRETAANNPPIYGYNLRPRETSRAARS